MESPLAKPGRRTPSLSKRIAHRVRLPVFESLDQVVVIDRATQDSLAGWAMHAAGVHRVDVYVEGRRVGQARTGVYRHDVAARVEALPLDVDDETAAEAAHCGFVYLFSADDLVASGRDVVSVHVVCHAGGGQTCSSFPVDLPAARLPSRYAPAPEGDRYLAHPSPFPLDVERTLRALRGDGPEEDRPWTPGRVDAAVDDLILAHQVASRDTQGLFRYFSYLREIWMRIEFNAKHFPSLNRTASVSGNDLHGIGTSPIELFVIAHHLAALQSRGVEGAVCEFGCFKGFSTSALSEACVRLGLCLDVFDSFAGLPPSESTYYREGDFKGSREEVEANVREFGDLSVVRFHEGFFSESVHLYPEPKIACLWLDVDLEVSARDAMRILPRMDPRGCVFSDECAPEDFVSGEINREASPDRVIAPICDAFDQDGRKVAGSFISGHTGCFRDPDESIPVLSVEPLLRLKDALI